jgi:cell division initiation protein
LTPAAIRTAEPPRVWLRGYRRDDVLRLLDDVADELAGALRERELLESRIEDLESELEKHHELEAALSSALVAAEEGAQEAKAQARREADLIVREAHAEARRTVREAQAERRQLEDDMNAVRARLRSALESSGHAAEPAPSVREEPSVDAVVQAPETNGSPASGVREVVS